VGRQNPERAPIRDAEYMLELRVVHSPATVFAGSHQQSAEVSTDAIDTTPYVNPAGFKIDSAAVRPEQFTTSQATAKQFRTNGGARSSASRL
jgi:hypothetical protein